MICTPLQIKEDEVEGVCGKCRGED